MEARERTTCWSCRRDTPESDLCGHCNKPLAYPEEVRQQNLAAALAAAAAGYPVCPGRHGKGGKAPVTPRGGDPDDLNHLEDGAEPVSWRDIIPDWLFDDALNSNGTLKGGFLKSSVRPDWVDRIWGSGWDASAREPLPPSVAMVVPRGAVAVDVDVDKETGRTRFPPDLLKVLQEAATCIVQTPSGGQHIWFKAPADRHGMSVRGSMYLDELGKPDKAGREQRVRVADWLSGRKGYAFAPGSIRVPDGAYTLTKGTLVPPSELAPIPAGALARLKEMYDRPIRPKAERKSRAKQKVDWRTCVTRLAPDGNAAVDEAAAVAAAEAAVEKLAALPHGGGERHNAALSRTASLAGRGVFWHAKARRTFISMLIAHWPDRQDEIEELVASSQERFGADAKAAGRRIGTARAIGGGRYRSRYRDYLTAGMDILNAAGISPDGLERTADGKGFVMGVPHRRFRALMTAALEDEHDKLLLVRQEKWIKKEDEIFVLRPSNGIWRSGGARDTFTRNHLRLTGDRWEDYFNAEAQKIVDNTDWDNASAKEEKSAKEQIDALMAKAAGWTKVPELPPEGVLASASSDWEIAVLHGSPNLPERVSPLALDADGRYLGVVDGSVDLLTGKHLPPEKTREKLLTASSPHAYKPFAEHPKDAQEDVLRLFAHMSPALARWWRLSLGYAMRGSVGSRAFYAIVGQQGSGKSSLFAALMNALGGELAQEAPANALQERKGGPGDATPDQFAFVNPSRFALIDECEPGQARGLSQSTIKRLVGSQTYKVRHLYLEFEDRAPTANIILAANPASVPRFGLSDQGIRSKYREIPYPAVPEAAKAAADIGGKSFFNRMREDPTRGSAMLAWLIEASVECGDRPYPPEPEGEVADAIDERTRAEGGELAAWAEDHLVRGGAGDRLTLSAAWESYCAFNGVADGADLREDEKVGGHSRRFFAQNLQEFIPDLPKPDRLQVNGRRERGWSGWKLGQGAPTGGGGGRIFDRNRHAEGVSDLLPRAGAEMHGEVGQGAPTGGGGGNPINHNRLAPNPPHEPGGGGGALPDLPDSKPNYRGRARQQIQHADGRRGVSDLLPRAPAEVTDRVGQVGQRPPGDPWTCPDCRTLNPPSAAWCSGCYHDPPDSQNRLPPDDWNRRKRVPASDTPFADWDKDLDPDYTPDVSQEPDWNRRNRVPPPDGSKEKS